MIRNPQKKQKNKKGFTLIELLIVVAIIGILATLFIVAWALTAQDKAAISNYKRQMQSVRAAIVLCKSAGVNPNISGSQGQQICSLGANPPLYPTIDNACEMRGATFIVESPTSSRSWSVTTSSGCVGCIGVCNISGCSFSNGSSPC